MRAQPCCRGRPLAPPLPPPPPPPPPPGQPRPGSAACRCSSGCCGKDGSSGRRSSGHSSSSSMRGVQRGAPCKRQQPAAAVAARYEGSGERGLCRLQQPPRAPCEAAGVLSDPRILSSLPCALAHYPRPPSPPPPPPPTPPPPHPDLHAAHAADAGALRRRARPGGRLVCGRGLGPARLHRALPGRLAHRLPGRLPGPQAGGSTLLCTAMLLSHQGTPACRRGAPCRPWPLPTRAALHPHPPLLTRPPTRHQNASSAFGAFLDPVADKLMVSQLGCLCLRFLRCLLCQWRLAVLDLVPDKLASPLARRAGGGRRADGGRWCQQRARGMSAVASSGPRC